MTSTELTTQAHEAEIVTPDVTDDGLALLQKQAEALGAAHKIATVLCSTGMVPQAYRGKPDDGAAAILYGAEVGLKPQQALQQVFVVHGQPSIYARTMVGLLKARGYRFETVDTSDESVTVRATSPRGEVEEATWDIARATKAGYTSNKKYTTDPQGMLYAKAASEVSRKIAPDVLLGIRYSAEDLELEPLPVRATAERVDRPRKGRSALDRAKKKPEPVQDDPQVKAAEGIEAAGDAETLDKILNWAANQGLTAGQLDHLQDLAAQRATALGLTAEEA
ncbi:hypothetical protein [Corynebacterium provencense]|uniref:hypothetical protein n=1 Tax=Corynebacterium provencense TaxID=1737425 RepID=UPI0008346434|nr:hypothetical protein [Corynebacterium provencense]